jgi:hydroxymethylpyrimidine/phosphomethylpyrimidine kinase
MKKTKNLLIIAGSDPSGGAGLQADLKTATAHKIYASAVITCLTAQNTQKVAAIHNPPIEFLQKQLEMVLSDINFGAVKIGMLGSKEIIKCVDKNLTTAQKIVLDPVMVATSGDLLLEENAIEALKILAKKAFLITPNIDEAQILANMQINSLEDMKKAALIIKKLGAKNVLIKGGHLKNKDKIENILLDEQNKIYIIKNNKVKIGNVHGTGCTLASAVACNLAHGFDILKSVKKANNYVYKAIVKNLTIGKGSKVLKHF